jgi:endo-1,4-beta-xylanase
MIVLLPLIAAVAALAADSPIALKDVAPPALKIGVAINQALSDQSDPAGVAIVVRQFNAISPENLLKWESVHPASDRYNFEPADRYVEFGRSHGMFVVGHVLLWHQQTPAWVFASEAGAKVTREVLLARLKDHITTVVRRYRGKIGGWDVVNEALEDDGSLRHTPWRDAIGGRTSWRGPSSSRTRPTRTRNSITTTTTSGSPPSGTRRFGSCRA